MKNLTRIFACALCVLFLFSLPSPALADIAPPEQNPGSNPSSNAQTTQVRMLEELVTIIPGPEVTINQYLTALQTDVLAEFWMLNSGPEDETLQVRFPLTDPQRFHAYGDYSPELQDFSATVDGQMVEVTTKEFAYPSGGSGTWAQFNVAFPKGKMVKIDARYRAFSSGYDHYATFSYVLESGAGWKGTIGKGSIVLALPYEANPQNMIFEESTAKPEPKIVGNQVVWSFTDLEPSSADNWYATIVFPSSWQKIGEMRQQVSLNPQNGEAWLELGKAYLGNVLEKGGRDVNAPLADLLYLAEDALARAAALLPERFDAQAGLLHAYSAHQFNLYQGLKPLDPTLLNSAYTAFLRLIPNTPEAEDLLNFYVFLGYADQAPDPSTLVTKTFDPENLAQTPVPTFEEYRVAEKGENFLTQPGTPQPLPQPSPTPQPSATSKPEPTKVVEASPSPQASPATLATTAAPQQAKGLSGSLLLLGAAVVVFGVLGFFWISRSKK